MLQIPGPVNSMDRINKLVHACLLLKDTEVRRMISEGVDINGLSVTYQATALMFAIGSHRSTEILRILLGRNDIKIATKNKYGRTALHYACDFNNVEGVKLFLEYPTCNKDIVNLKDDCEETAEMIVRRQLR